MTKFKIWLEAARLRTLPLSLSGIIFGSAIAYNDNIFNGKIFFLALLATLCFQVLSNFANDLGDTLKGADNEHRVGPMRAVQSGGISIAEMKVGVVITSVISLIVAALLIWVSSEGKGFSFWLFYLILAVLCIAAAILYTIGKKAYGYNGLGDVFVFIFFGLVSVVGVYHLYPESISLATFNWSLFLPATTIGAFSMAVLNLNNMRDRESDEKSGKNTLAVRLGFRKAKVYHSYIVLVGISSFILYLIFFVHNGFASFLFLLPILLFHFHLKDMWKVQQGKDFDPFLKKVALSTFLLSCLFFIVSLIQHV